MMQDVWRKFSATPAGADRAWKCMSTFLEVVWSWSGRRSDSSVAMLRVRQMRLLCVRQDARRLRLLPLQDLQAKKDVVHVLLVQGSELWCITSICGLRQGSSAINTQHRVREKSEQSTSRTAWALPSAEVRTSAGRNSVADTSPGTTNSTCKKKNEQVNQDGKT